MSNAAMSKQLAEKPGFLAALDQSGGSTPGALRAYGIPDTAYNGDAEMFKLMHEMRVRIMSAPAFTGDKIIAAILFERTMDGEAGGKPECRRIFTRKIAASFRCSRSTKAWKRKPTA